MATTAKQTIAAVDTKLAQQTALANGLAGGKTPSDGIPSVGTLDNALFVFMVSWFVWLALLTAFSKTRVGYVFLYYSLLLMILFVILTEVNQLSPYINSISSISSFNAKHPNTPVVGGPKSGETKA
jgi:hypothetical protein